MAVDSETVEPELESVFLTEMEEREFLRTLCHNFARRGRLNESLSHMGSTQTS